MKTYTDEFGCLPLSGRVDWGWGAITPLPDQSDVWAAFEESADPQSKIVHIPIQETRTEDPLTGDVSDPIPGTRRAADMYPLSDTHALELRHPQLSAASQAEARHGLAGFTVLYSGFLLGHRTQFTGWRVYGACPARRVVSFTTSPSGLARCLDLALPAWERLEPTARTILSNVLFQHLRARVLDFDWERFLLEYILCDACYRIAVTQGMRRAPTHAERWKTLSDWLGIPRDSEGDEVIQDLVHLRNNLFHESLWGSQALGHGYPEATVRPDLQVAHFLERAVLRILRIDAEYCHSKWWNQLSTFLLRPEGGVLRNERRPEVGRP